MKKGLFKRGFVSIFIALIFSFVTINSTGQAFANRIENKLILSTYSEEEIECLTEAVYFEARGESLEGHQAVVEVVLNRLDNPTKFPNSICGVIKQKYQFSYRLYPLTVKNPQLYNQIRIEVREHVFNIKVLGLEHKRVIAKCSDHYDGVGSKAKWIKNMKNPQQLENHIFYCSETIID